MELNIGDYVRDEKGNIDKYIGQREEAFTYGGLGGAVSLKPQTIKYYEKDNIKAPIIKSSPNIIDLIEVGDYANGCIVINKKDETIQIIQLIIPFDLKEKDIKSIVTKEQFESMEYKIGE